MMRHVTALALAATVLGGCDVRHSPSAPSRNEGAPIRPVAIPPGGSPTSSALRADLLTATVRRLPTNSREPSHGLPFQYSVKFNLVETTGLGGATLDSIQIVVNGDSFLSGAYCWGAAIRVAPGQTLQLFADGVDEALGYCSPGPVASTAAASTLMLLAGFIDDQGRYGRLEAIANVSPIGE